MLYVRLRIILCACLLAGAAAAEDPGPVRQLTRRSMDIGWPRWSPDGSSIAFWGIASGGLGIRVITADGADMRLLTNPLDRPGMPVWSPDSLSIT